MKPHPYFYVYLSDVPGVEEFDSSLARALAGETPGSVDVECTVEAESAEEALRIVRARWGEEGRIDSVLRVGDLVLPRLSQPARPRDSTLGAFHRRGPRLRVANESGIDLDVLATVKAMEWGRYHLLQGIDLEVWRLGCRPEPLALAAGESADCVTLRHSTGDEPQSPRSTAWNCLACGHHHSSGYGPKAICEGCGWYDCGHRSHHSREMKCSNYRCLAGTVGGFEDGF